MNAADKTYQTETGEGFLTVRLIGECNLKTLKGFEEYVMKTLGEQGTHVIINCEHLTYLSPDWLRSILKVQAYLKQGQKHVRLILVPPDIKVSLKKEGLDLALHYSSNLKEALIDVGLNTRKILDTDFINPFLNATLHVLSVQASVQAQAGKIYLKKDGDKFQGDISGVIGIVSDTFTGSVVISFPEKTFLAIMSGMLGEEYKTLSQDLIDGAGELTNMIFGQSKVVLNEKGFGVKTAIPSVVSGKDHSLSPQTHGPIVVIPFTSSAGPFFVEICINS